ncbi:MAG: arsenate reductase ArsC [Thermoguttaceae bacterium]|nr:arsenate reductase ArsC [Thermoguttaceae bacterium]MDW8036437.1 arsenate reductase ArsC [Thermoguttaceae bacterium]
MVVSEELRKLKVLFLCTGNSCRSQMAEGWAKALHPELLDAYSAGIEPQQLNPDAVRVMAEVGVDISGHRSKHVHELAGMNFDYVITVCDQAKEQCPVFPGQAKRLHVGFEDPPRLAALARTEEERMAIYRQIRDQIRSFIEQLPKMLEKL